MNTALHYGMGLDTWTYTPVRLSGLGDAASTVQTTSAIATPIVLGGLSAEASAAAAASGTAATLIGLPLAVAVPVIGAAIAGITMGIVALLRSGCGQACVITSNWANQAESLLKQNIDAYFKLTAPRTDYQKSVALANFDSIWNYLVSQCQAVPGGAGENCINDRKAGACKWKGTSAPAYPGAPGPGQCWNWFSGYRDPIAQDPTVADTPMSSSTATSGISDLLGSLTSGTGINPYLLIGGVLLAAAFLVGEA